MTDEQFKQLMNVLERIERNQRMINNSTLPLNVNQYPEYGVPQNEWTPEMVQAAVQRQQQSDGLPWQVGPV